MKAKDINNVAITAVNSMALNGVNANGFARLFTNQPFDFNKGVAAGIYELRGDSVSKACEGLPENALAGVMFTGISAHNRNSMLYLMYGQPPKLYFRAPNYYDNDEWVQII